VGHNIKVFAGGMIVALSLESRNHSGHRHFETERDDFQCREADVLLPALHIADVAAVNTERISHLNLCPALGFAQRFQAPSKSDRDVFSGHALIINCRL